MEVRMNWWRLVVGALKALLGRRISNERQLSVLVREGSEAIKQAVGRVELSAVSLEAVKGNVIAGIVQGVQLELGGLKKEMVAEIVKAAVPRFQAEIARSLRAEVLGLSELFAACATLVEIGRDRTETRWGGNEGAEDRGGGSAEEKDVKSALESWVLQHTGRGSVGSGGA